jgi:hypothetical protein
VRDEDESAKKTLASLNSPPRMTLIAPSIN